MEKMIDMEAFCNGDKNEFRKVMDKYYMDLRFYAEKFHKNSGVAPEITNESFIRLFNKHKDFVSEQAVKSFLYKVVTNLSINELQTQKARKTRERNYCLSLPSIEEPSILFDSIQKDMWTELVKRIEELSDGCKTILKMHYYEGLSIDEIARLLDTNTRNVANQLYYGRQKLLKMFLNDTSS
jgi:RNA polymerase sigma factor, sigma-70 family